MTTVIVPSRGGASAVARAPGPPGPPGWSPVLAVVADGDRRVLQVSSWVGGTGQPPGSGQYLGPNGFTPNIFQALDVRGLRGLPGDAATIEIGDVTTLPPGEPATVVNVGTDTAAVFDIAIPQGVPGDIEGLTAAAIVAALTYTPADRARTITGAGLLEGQGGDLTADRVFTVNPSTVAEVRAGATDDSVITPGVQDDALARVPVADAATIAWDLAAAPNGVVSMAASRTVGPPTNATVGKFYSLRINSTGAFAPAFNSCFDFGALGPGSFPSGAGKYGILDVQCESLSPLSFRSNLWKGA